MNLETIRNGRLEMQGVSSGISCFWTTALTGVLFWLAAGNCALAGMEKPGLVFYAGFEGGLNATVLARGNPPELFGGNTRPEMIAGKAGPALCFRDESTAVRYSLPGGKLFNQGSLLFFYRPDALLPAAGKTHSLVSLPRISAGLWAYEKTYLRVDIFDRDCRGDEPGHRHVQEADLALATGAWRHLAVTWDSRAAVIRIYLDGSEITGAEMPAIIGKPWEMGPQDFIQLGPNAAGAIDEIKLYDRVLTRAEIEDESGIKPRGRVVYRHQGGDLTKAPGKPEAQVSIPPTARPPDIDGRIQAAEWQSSAVITDFHVFNQAGKLPFERTSARLCYDATNLYIAFLCRESRLQEMEKKGSPATHDVYTGEDGVEILLEPNLDHATLLHFILTAVGARFDQKEIRPRAAETVESDLSWNPVWSAAVATGDGQWTAEAAIPWKEIGVAGPFPGMSFGLNLCRERNEVSPERPGRPRREYTSWTYTPQGFQNPTALGLAVLGESPWLFLGAEPGSAGIGRNLLRGWVENTSARPRQLTAALRISPAGDEKPPAAVTLTAPANAVLPVELEYPVAATDTIYQIELNMEETDSRRKIAAAQYEVLSPQALLAFDLPRKEYFVDDETAEALVELGLGELSLQAARLELSVFQGGKLIARRELAQPGFRQTIPFDISGVPKGGVARLSLKLLDGKGGVLGSAEQEIRKNRYTFPVAFDFGPTNSPLARYYRRVTERTAYGPGGFGWATTGLVLRSYAIPPQDQWGPENKRFNYNTFYNDATRDCVFFAGSDPAAASRFTCAISNGSYRVYMTSILWPHVAMNSLCRVAEFKVRANGREAAEVKMPVFSTVAFTQFPVEIRDNTLTLEFAPAAGGWVVNSMVAWPVADTPYAEAEIDRMEREIFILPEEEKINWQEVKLKHRVTYEGPACECLAWVVNPVEKIHADSVPEAPACAPALGLFGAPGEYEPASFALHAFRDFENVDVRMTALTAPGGKSIGRPALELRRVRFAPRRMGRPVPGQKRRYSVTSELLLAETGVKKVCAGETLQWWLTIHIPDDAAPGVYAGQAVISAGEQKLQELPVSLEVLSVKLARSPIHYGFYYASPLTHISPNYNPPAFADPALVLACTARLRADVREMVAHGMDMYIPTADYGWVIRRGSNIVTETWAASEAMKAGRQAGMDGPIMIGLDSVAMNDLPRAIGGKAWSLAELNQKGWQALFTPEYKKEFENFVAQVDARAQQEKWGNYGYFGIDEASGHVVVFSRELLKAVKSVNRNIVTGSTYADERILGPWLDIYMSLTMRPARQFDLALGRKVRAAGCAWWSYHNTLQDPFTPAMQRYLAGWQALKLGLGGVTMWIYQQPAGNPFNHLDGRCNDWGIAYPGPDGPIPTIQYEVIREAVDDMRYAETLRQIIAASGNRNRETKKLAKTAEAYLAEVLASVNENLSGKDCYAAETHEPLEQQPGWPAEKFTQVRRRIADFIVELQKQAQ